MQVFRFFLNQFIVAVPLSFLGELSPPPAEHRIREREGHLGTKRVVNTDSTLSLKKGELIDLYLRANIFLPVHKQIEHEASTCFPTFSGLTAAFACLSSAQMEGDYLPEKQPHQLPLC